MSSPFAIPSFVKVRRINKSNWQSLDMSRYSHSPNYKFMVWEEEPVNSPYLDKYHCLHTDHGRKEEGCGEEVSSLDQLWEHLTYSHHIHYFNCPVKKCNLYLPMISSIVTEHIRTAHPTTAVKIGLLEPEQTAFYCEECSSYMLGFEKFDCFKCYNDLLNQQAFHHKTTCSHPHCSKSSQK